MKRPPTRLNVRDIDPDVLARFKSEAATRGRTMKGLVIAFMNAVSNKIEEKNKGVLDVGELSRRYREPK